MINAGKEYGNQKQPFSYIMDSPLLRSNFCPLLEQQSGTKYKRRLHQRIHFPVFGLRLAEAAGRNGLGVQGRHRAPFCFGSTVHKQLSPQLTCEKFGRLSFHSVLSIFTPPPQGLLAQGYTLLVNE